MENYCTNCNNNRDTVGKSGLQCLQPCTVLGNSKLIQGFRFKSSSLVSPSSALTVCENPFFRVGLPNLDFQVVRFSLNIIRWVLNQEVGLSCYVTSLCMHRVICWQLGWRQQNLMPKLPIEGRSFRINLDTFFFQKNISRAAQFELRWCQNKKLLVDNEQLMILVLWSLFLVLWEQFSNCCVVIGFESQLSLFCYFYFYF